NAGPARGGPGRDSLHRPPDLRRGGRRPAVRRPDRGAGDRLAQAPDPPRGPPAVTLIAPGRRETPDETRRAMPSPDTFTFDVLFNDLLIGAALMALGMLGSLTRRNLIVMFLSAEMMLQGTALTLIGFSRYHGNWTGQVFTIVILTVAACEAAVAL